MRILAHSADGARVFGGDRQDLVKIMIDLFGYAIANDIGVRLSFDSNANSLSNSGSFSGNRDRLTSLNYSWAIPFPLFHRLSSYWQTLQTNHPRSNQFVHNFRGVIMGTMARIDISLLGGWIKLGKLGPTCPCIANPGIFLAPNN